MSGIAACFGTRDDVDLRRIVAKLGHRGPDGTGTYAIPGVGYLGYTRLAVMDPARGMQPFVHPDRALALVINGTVYNDRALRDALSDARFRTECDVEVVLHGYAAWGAGVFERLDGPFAAVLVDGERMIAARDAQGGRPLFWSTDADGIVRFASEAKALVGIGPSIAEFPPGRIWDSVEGLCPFTGYRAPVNSVVDALESAVAKCLRSDMPVGILLTGRTGDALVAVLSARLGGQPRTFAAGLADSAHLAAARGIAERIDARHHEVVVTPGEVFGELSRILYHLETFERDAVLNAIPLYLAARAAGRCSKVGVSGEGATLPRPPVPGAEAVLAASLRRLDRMTNANAIDGRAPLTDPAVQQASPDGLAAALRREGPELANLVAEASDRPCDGGLAEVVARDAAAFGRELLSNWPGFRKIARSPEEAWFAKLLADAFDDPTPLLNLVRGTAERPAAA